MSERRDLLAEILSGEGYDVLEAENGAVALRLAASDPPPDFVCLDIMMPECSGFEVCRRLRAARPQMPIVFISAKSEEIDKVVGLELGADDFIVKPFDADRLRSLLERQLKADLPS